MIPRHVILFLGLGAGLANAIPAAAPSPTVAETPECPVLCIDGINECGVGWGACYNVCQPESSPVPPPCTKTKHEPYNTPPPIYLDNNHGDGKGCKPPKPTSTDNCSTRTVCADYINECGMMYGGCFPDCRPWPTFTPPPCPSGWSTTPEPTPTPTSWKDEDCDRIICVDYINECGIPYGGCHPDCAPYPTYTPPPCP